MLWRFQAPSAHWGDEKQGQGGARPTQSRFQAQPLTGMTRGTAGRSIIALHAPRWDNGRTREERFQRNVASKRPPLAGMTREGR